MEEVLVRLSMNVKNTNARKRKDLVRSLIHQSIVMDMEALITVTDATTVVMANVLKSAGVEHR